MSPTSKANLWVAFTSAAIIAGSAGLALHSKGHKTADQSMETTGGGLIIAGMLGGLAGLGGLHRQIGKIRREDGPK